MIILVLRGGLGNQLFEFAAGLHRTLGNESSLRIDDRFLLKDRNGRAPQLALLGLRTRRVGAILHGVTRLIMALVRRLPEVELLRCNRLWSYTAETANVRSRQQSRAPLLQILDGYWQRYDTVGECANKLRNELRVTSNASAAASDFLSQVAEKVTLAIHVRRGDYVTDPEADAVHGTCGADYYHRAVEFVDSRVRIQVILVFSDDLQWARQNLQLDSRCIYVNTDRTLTDIDEFRIMARCRHFIIANSTFSWWAARLSESPDKIVVAPRRWYRDPRVRDDGLIPPEWFRLD